MRPRLVAAICLVFLAALGCPHPPPVKVPPSPPAIHVPPGCEADLSGAYVHANDPTYLYRGHDDGGTWVLEVGRAFATVPDGGREDVRIELARTPNGFVGQTRADAFNSASQRCPLSLPTEVKACDDAGVTLSTVGQVELDARCQITTGPSRVDERLLRVDAGAR